RRPRSGPVPVPERAGSGVGSWRAMPGIVSLPSREVSDCGVRAEFPIPASPLRPFASLTAGDPRAAGSAPRPRPLAPVTEGPRIPTRRPTDESASRPRDVPRTDAARSSRPPRSGGAGSPPDAVRHGADLVPGAGDPHPAAAAARVEPDDLRLPAVPVDLLS